MNGLSRRALLLAGTAALATGCASPPADRVAARRWSGRMALRVDTEPAQAFSAEFELTGAATAGELKLLNPLGGTVALLSWAPGQARLFAGSDIREFASLDQLADHVMGTTVPVAALFDWLDGTNTRAAGWLADLSRLADGRLQAQRIEPAPRAELRLVLER